MVKDMQPVMTIDSDGDTVWRTHAGYHRTDGPAIEYADGSKQWYLNGEHHRIDGPATEWNNGHFSWWLYGFCYTFDAWLKVVPNLTYAEKVMLKLEYG
jgi:hypothetical protein